MAGVQHSHPTSRKYLELTQDAIVLGLCSMLFVAMGIKLFHLGQRMFEGTDFSLVVGDILFLLVLLELFRLLVIYLEEHRVSVSTMVEVGIVSTLREVILRGALHIEWPQLLVVCVFILTLGLLLRYSGITASGRQMRVFRRVGRERTSPAFRGPAESLPTKPKVYV
jgi:uncharacterized membrane protein (DUF373 family)